MAGVLRRVGRGRRLVAKVRVLRGLGFCLALHFLRHLVAPGEDAGEPPGRMEAAGGVRRRIGQSVLVVGFVGLLVFFGFFGFCRQALGFPLGAAGGALLVDGQAFFLHAAAHAAEPLPHFRRGHVKDVQAGTQGQRPHHEVCRRAAAQQQQIAAQQRPQHTAGEPGVDAVLVAGRHHGGGRQVGGNLRKHDDRAAGKGQPQQQLGDVGQQVFAPGVQNGQITQGRAQHKAAAPKQAEQPIVQRAPD